MLDPDQRTLYTDALKPPPGFRFREAVATTYSLDLETLLTIPLHLALFSTEGDTEELLTDGVALLEALRRTTDHVTVYAQASRLLAPSRPNVLFGLLEPCVVEVDPPAEGGVFHPKLWLIRFEQPSTGMERIRLLVLSRNITNDRSWDLALSLDGQAGESQIEESAQLAHLLETLPSLAVSDLPPGRRKVTERMAELSRTVTWELPGDFENIRFHTTGVVAGQGWLPERSRRLGVISPFVSDGALRDLSNSTQEPGVLVSRPEELQEIDPETTAAYARVLTLAEEAEREDGEETLSRRDALHPGHGLHAKAYVAERGWWTHLYLGSANATNAALLNGVNVELLAELVGRRSRVGSVEDLLDGDGLGAILVDFQPEDAPPPVDDAQLQAEEALETARRSLAASGLELSFAPTPEGEWSVTLTAAEAPELAGVTELNAWLVTRQSTLPGDALGLRDGEPVELPRASVVHLTSFVAFEMDAPGADEPVRFVLSLPAEGLPTDDRDAAIVRDVIRNRDGFLRYVMLLLGEAGLDGGMFGGGGSFWTRSRRLRGSDEALPVFEHMTRVFCEDPQRLTSVERLLAEMGAEMEGDGDADEDGDADVDSDADVVPREFLELWSVFQEALRRTEEADR